MDGSITMLACMHWHSLQRENVLSRPVVPHDGEVLLWWAVMGAAETRPFRFATSDGRVGKLGA